MGLTLDGHGLTEYQECGFVLFGEALNIDATLPQQSGDIFGAAVSKANPYDLRGRTKEDAEAVKVFILCHQQTPAIEGELPHCRVHCPTRTELPNMQRVWKDIV